MKHKSAKPKTSRRLFKLFVLCLSIVGSLTQTTPANTKMPVKNAHKN